MCRICVVNDRYAVNRTDGRPLALLQCYFVLVIQGVAGVLGKHQWVKVHRQKVKFTAVGGSGVVVSPLFRAFHGSWTPSKGAAVSAPCGEFAQPSALAPRGVAVPLAPDDGSKC